MSWIEEEKNECYLCPEECPVCHVQVRGSPFGDLVMTREFFGKGGAVHVIESHWCMQGHKVAGREYHPATGTICGEV